MESLLISVDPRTLSRVAAEDATLDAQLIQRLQGVDLALLERARVLADESRAGYPNWAAVLARGGDQVYRGCSRRSHHMPAGPFARSP